MAITNHPYPEHFARIHAELDSMIKTLREHPDIPPNITDKGLRVSLLATDLIAMAAEGATTIGEVHEQVHNVIDLIEALHQDIAKKDPATFETQTSAKQVPDFSKLVN